VIRTDGVEEVREVDLNSPEASAAAQSPQNFAADPILLGPCEGWKVYRMEPMPTLCAALFTGGALYISLVEHPARMADMAIALREFRHSYKRAAPASLYCRDLLSDSCASVGFND
jgi:hypothetical protein